jgi:hypothetical protein
MAVADADCGAVTGGGGFFNQAGDEAAPVSVVVTAFDVPLTPLLSLRSDAAVAAGAAPDVVEKKSARGSDVGAGVFASVCVMQFVRPHVSRLIGQTFVVKAVVQCGFLTILHNHQMSGIN